MLLFFVQSFDGMDKYSQFGGGRFCRRVLSLKLFYTSIGSISSVHAQNSNDTVGEICFISFLSFWCNNIINLVLITFCKLTPISIQRCKMFFISNPHSSIRNSTFILYYCLLLIKLFISWSPHTPYRLKHIFPTF